MNQILEIKYLHLNPYLNIMGNVGRRNLNNSVSVIYDKLK